MTDLEDLSPEEREAILAEMRARDARLRHEQDEINAAEAASQQKKQARQDDDFDPIAEEMAAQDEYFEGAAERDRAALEESDRKDREGETRQAQQQQEATQGLSPYISRSKNRLIHEGVNLTIMKLREGTKLSLAEINQLALHNINRQIKLENIERKSNDSAAENFGQLTFEQHLSVTSVGRLLLELYDIVTLDLNKSGRRDGSMLGIYQHTGKREGLWEIDDSELRRLAVELEPKLADQNPEKALDWLRDNADLRQVTHDPNLIAMNNGIFDRTEMALHPFSKDYVFLNKSPVDYKTHPTNPVIHHPEDGTVWDVESWIAELSDDEGVPELLWEVISAVLRPHEAWNQAAFLHSDQGNNGKGTFLQMCRNLIGEGAHVSIPMVRFSDRFALAGLIRAQAVMTDENPVGGFAKDLDAFKSAISGDMITIERKYKDEIYLRWRGMVIQCVNDFPQTRDKSSSWARRQLFIPFRKWFGGGIERKYIKNDYLARPEVLEYVAHKALHMTHTEFSEPPAVKELLAEAARQNDPVKEFWSELSEDLVWDFQPKNWLYDLFVQWFKKNHPSGTLINKKRFWTDLTSVLREDEHWVLLDDKKVHRPGQSAMDSPEPLIREYEVTDWMNQAAKGFQDTNKLCTPPVAKTYRGGLRRVVQATPAFEDDNE